MLLPMLSLLCGGSGAGIGLARRSSGDRGIGRLGGGGGRLGPGRGEDDGVEVGTLTPAMYGCTVQAPDLLLDIVALSQAPCMSVVR